MKLVDLEIKRGRFVVLRVDGEISTHDEKPNIRRIEREIGAEYLDTVTLDRTNLIIMMVDDTGMVDGKPVNEAATTLVKQAFGQNYPYSIHGDVAIVCDQDFA